MRSLRAGKVCRENQPFAVASDVPGINVAQHQRVDPLRRSDCLALYVEVDLAVGFHIVFGFVVMMSNDFQISRRLVFL